MNTTENTQHTRRYFEELNFVRAIACLMVVMVHVTARHYVLNEQHFNAATLFLNQITRFGTPVFAVLSGFLLYNQALQKGFSLKPFIVSRSTKILSPFIIWSFFYLWVKDYPFPWVEGGHATSDFLLLFFLGDSWSHLYFLIVVLQFYLLFPFLQRIRSLKGTLFLTVVSFWVTYFHLRSPFTTNSDVLNTFIGDRSSLFYWLFYFSLGMLLVHLWKPVVSWIQQHVSFVMWIGVVMAIFSVYEYLTFGRYSSTRVSNLFFIPLFIFSVTALYFRMERWKKLRGWIIGIGNLSMGIYLLHPFILYLLQHHMPVLLDKTRYIPFSFLLTVVLSALLVSVISRFPLGSYVVTVASKRTN